LVGDAAVLVSSVIGKARRNEENWLYLDVGVFNGLMETVERFTYEFDFDGADERPWGAFTIAGPSCDSMDVMFMQQNIPDLRINERLYILNAGAYTGSYASYFNGFAPPKVIYTDELAEFRGTNEAEPRGLPVWAEVTGY
jgi:ornithine decarboxylase